MWHSCILRLCCLQIKACWAIFNLVFYVSIPVYPLDGCVCQQPCFSMAMWFMCSCFSALFCSHAGTIILLPSMVILSAVVVSSLNDQYGCSSFCTSAFVYGQPCNTYSDSIHNCSLSIVTNHISSAVMHSGSFTHSRYFFISICFMVVSGQPICYE